MEISYLCTILHQNKWQYQGSIHRSRYGEMLSHLLGFGYGKTKGDSMKVFNVIYPKTRIAIGNAQKVLESFDGSNLAKEESSTTVHHSRHVILGATEVYLHLLRLRSIYTKQHATIFEHTRIAVAVYVSYWRVRSFRKVLFSKRLCRHLGTASSCKNSS